MIPDDRYYTKEHEWIKVEGGVASIGITDHAQHELGDIVFVELPEPGEQFLIGESIAVVESVKAVSNIYTQVAGAVVSVRQELLDKPEKLNTAPYDTPICVLALESDALGEVLSAAEYEKLLEGKG